MRLSCPACQAETSLDVLIGREADARALGDLLAANLPLGGLVVSYLALFRPPKRRLSIARALGLFAELQADVQRGAINRKGRDWPAPAAVWRAAIEQVLAARDRGTLTTPLTSHGYLYEVVAGLADKAEGLAEREAEAARRSRGHVAEPQAVEVAVAVAGLWTPASNPAGAAVIAGAPPYDLSKGPSRAARELRARMQAGRSAAAAADPSVDGDPA